MARNRFEKRRDAIKAEQREHVQAYKAIYSKAEGEDRDPDTDEQKDIVDHLSAIETLDEELKSVQANIDTLKAVDDKAKELGPSAPLISDEARVTADRQDRLIAMAEKSLGEMFTDSKEYKALQREMQDGGRLRQGASTGAVPLEMKGTLLEGAGGGGGALAATVPQVVPGVVEKQFQQLTVVDLLMSGQATTNSLRYVVEGTATSGAAGVAERGLKPESTLGLTTTDEPVKKIATILPVSEEMLEDAPQVQSYINGRLSLFVRIEEERQVLRGAGTDELVGLMAAARGINVYAGGTAAGNKAEQIFKAMNGQRGSALIEPDFIVLSPADYQDIRLLKDANNQYFGGGPFLPPYGASGWAGIGQSQVTAAIDSLWQKPVVVTSAIGSGTALIGTRSAAQVWNRGGLSVEASNSHDDFFRRNMVAIRAEQREALAVYRPVAFTDVRLA